MNAFRSSRSQTLGLLIRQAKCLAAAQQPLPLDLYAALDNAGIDINELERNARNGKA